MIFVTHVNECHIQQSGQQFLSPFFSFFFDSPGGELVLSGTLEKAQERKADALITRARLSKHHRLLDIGFGWGGISIRYLSYVHDDVLVGLLCLPSLSAVYATARPFLFCCC